MIIIKNIEFYEVDRDPCEILHETHPHEPVYLKADGSDIQEAMECSVFRELIRGRRFVRPSDHTDIVVGCSKQAEEVLGLIYEAWDNLAGDADRGWENYRITLKKLGEWEEYVRSNGKKLCKIQRASFWIRLKWLFTGVKEA